MLYLPRSSVVCNEVVKRYAIHNLFKSDQMWYPLYILRMLTFLTELFTCVYDSTIAINISTFIKCTILITYLVHLLTWTHCFGLLCQLDAGAVCPCVKSLCYTNQCCSMYSLIILILVVLFGHFHCFETLKYNNSKEKWLPFRDNCCLFLFQYFVYKTNILRWFGTLYEWMGLINSLRVWPYSWMQSAYGVVHRLSSYIILL